MLESLSVLKFKSSWRSYQKALLDNFDIHIADNHFHVIAPPGSGKTILGTEIMRRLGKKTLVLAPTLTIRNQWEDRLQTFFTTEGDFTKYSFDLKSPSDVTFTTYQALYAFYKSFNSKADYFTFFKTHQIETLVLDEAHHLKSAWWTCLNALKAEHSFFIVALTATPPYDSGQHELSKYFTLCGDIDDEISVPDLVREDDLCPHQDFVYFSTPSALEIDFIVKYREGIAQFREEIVNDLEFINFLKSHRYYQATERHLDAIYSNISFFSALLIFLNNAGVLIPISKLEVLGFDKGETIDFPELTLQWLELLFQELLVNDRATLEPHDTYLQQLEKRLRRCHVFEKRRVDFIGHNLVYKSLASSPSKLKSSVSIVASEQKALGKHLRCVILTDYIRDEFLNTPPEDIEQINKIGVVPIFQQLKHHCDFEDTLAVLTGSLVIIHTSIQEQFFDVAGPQGFVFSPLEVDANFLQIQTNSKTDKTIVTVMTALFEAGIIKILVGTKSLLGEGWDAPSINSLILASFVGSFVSSNQMRGRAIRKHADRPQKTANIWHLACLDPTTEDGGREVALLKRRFEAFVGISNDATTFSISNGLERLGLPESLALDTVSEINGQTLERAHSRPTTQDAWEASVGNGSGFIKQVQWLYPSEQSFKAQQKTYYFDVVRFFIAELCIAMGMFYLEFILESYNLIANKGVIYFIYAFVGAFVVRFGYKLYKAVILYMRHGFLSKKIHKMGYVIVDSLNALGFLDTPLEAIKVISERYEKGDISCYLTGANRYENTLFSNALTELLEAIEAPRYLIIKTNAFRKRLDIENFYPVPEVFGAKKSHAEVFQNYWTEHLGANTLVYTRHLKGRKLLLKARLHHAYNAFKKETKAVLIWK